MTRRLKIWQITIGEPIPQDGDTIRLHRAGQMSEWLAAQGHDVTFINSTFFHQKRQQRFDETTMLPVHEHLRVLCLFARPYQRSVSWSRFASHSDAARSMRSWLDTNPDKPDIIIASYPVEELCRVAADYGAKHNIPVIMDCRDFWPDIFVDILPGPLKFLARPVFAPLEKRAFKTLASADAISGHTASAMRWGIKKARRGQTDYDFHFPFSYPQTKSPTPTPPKEDSPIRIVFLGTLSERSGLEKYILALGALAEDEKSRIALHIAGTGDHKQALELLAETCGAPVTFHGWLDQEEMRHQLDLADYGLLPYDRSDFHISLPNKFIEYLSGGLPVLSCTIGEIEAFIKTHHCGQFSLPDSDNISACLRRLIKDGHQRDAASIHQIFQQHFTPDLVFSHVESCMQALVAAGPLAPRRDQLTEAFRYNQSAQSHMPAKPLPASKTLPAHLAAPYHAYEQQIARLITAEAQVLELGAGSGDNSLACLQQGAQLTALDIADEALGALTAAYGADFGDHIHLVNCDLGQANFADNQFDHVISAGAISYFDRDFLVAELARLIKPGGHFIAVDSWDINPIYRSNRKRQYRQGNRSAITLKNMPRPALLRALAVHFDVETTYFGALTFLQPLLAPIIPPSAIAGFLRITDKLLPGRWFGFKLVIIARRKHR